ncbi:uncharacterized protein RAG0_02837 [Rhynchosporium agropyri]|uniref:FHA domain-containing protein n=1 Tax=Rhynchosporium agropyri TaxID=914238 RepID=A0A1E1K2P8_9HELO|nr:uncharacterized protein RAG0_02837 [Rhynchosporium agropyri]
MIVPADLFYLQPNIDLRKSKQLTVPKLRDILNKHEVSYKLARTKEDLLSLLEHEVLPKKDAIIEYSTQARSAAGIYDARRDGTIVSPTRIKHHRYDFRALHPVYYGRVRHNDTL